MTREELWKQWADPSGWCEYMERGTPLFETKKDFFKDLDKYFATRQQEELEKTKEKIIEHMERLGKDEIQKAKDWGMDPEELREQAYKQLKNLKSIEL